MSVEGRQRVVRQHGYCKNCLARSHTSNDCTSADVCQKCGWAHHTLLHQENRQPPNAREQTLQGRHNVARSDRQSSQHRQQSRRPPQAPIRQHADRNRQSQLNIQRQSRIQDRISPYPRQRTHNRSVNDRSYERVNRQAEGSSPNPRRILLGALRALERLATTL